MTPRAFAVAAVALGAACAAIGMSAAPAPQEKTTWDGVYTTAQASRGEAIYTAKCARCHGATLAGIDSAPPLTGSEFNGNWNDLPLGGMFLRTKVSMPADRPGSLSMQESADAVAFLLSKSNFPAGETELPATLDGLNLIKYVAQKP